MNTQKISNTNIALIIILVVLLIVGAYFYSKHSAVTAPVVIQTATSSSSSEPSESVQPQPISIPVTISTSENATAYAYATYALKDPNRLPITQYTNTYGVELEFVANGDMLPTSLCLKVAADIPIKSISIAGHANDASTTIPSVKQGGAYEGISCFSGNIIADQDTTVFFDQKPSQINALLSPANGL